MRGSGRKDSTSSSWRNRSAARRPRPDHSLPNPLQLDSATAAVRDTAAAVFRARAYNREISVTLWDRFLAWVNAWIAEGLNTINHSPPMKHGLLAALIVLILGIVAHLVLTVYIPGTGASARWTLRGARSAAAGDPWALAQRLAAEGRYTEAAHALYGALLSRVAARVPLRLHPSKTAGDYARDLRSTAPSVFGPFREFARSYEVVIYRLGTCDRPRFEGLIDLAGRIDPELNQLARARHG